MYETIDNEEDKKIEYRVYSRRDFLKGAGIAVVATIAAGEGLFLTSTKKSLFEEIKDLPVFRIKEIWRVVPIKEMKCAGCQNCEIACSINHEGNGLPAPAYARIHVVNNLGEWFDDKMADKTKRYICRQCPGVPLCDEVCPVHAHYRDEKTGAVLIDHNKCIRCGRCVKVCPYDACYYSPELDKILKCDLCGGDPQCVKDCPMGVLKYMKVS